MSKLSVIIPVYNEENTILNIVNKVKNCGVPELEIIIVDDCSTDSTAQKLELLSSMPDIKILRHEVNKGKGAAIQTAQKNITGDYVIIQDADMEYSPDEFPRMMAPLEEDLADAVYGSRYSGREILVDTFWHYFGNKLLTTISNICSNLHLTDMETCYKMMRADLFKAMPLECNRFGFEPEVTAKLSRAKCRIYEMPISYRARSNDEGKKIGIEDAFAAIWFILKYNFFI